MPPFGFPTGSPAVRATTYFRSPERNGMSVTTYWEPDYTYATSAQLQDDVTSFDTQFKALLKVFMPALCTIVTTKGVYTSGSLYLDTFSTAAPVLGAITQDLLLEYNGIPDQDALLIQRRTSLAGRAHRGRIFIPCIAESVQDFGKIDVGDGPSVASVASFLGADVNVTLGIWHARHYNRQANALEVVTECRAMRNLGSRRDRKPPGVNLPV